MRPGHSLSLVISQIKRTLNDSMQILFSLTIKSKAARCSPQRIHRFVLVVLALAPSLAAAQSVLPDPNLETGTKMFGSYHGGNIDHVNLLTGGNNVDIPLISYPQRGGKLTLNFVLHYTSTQFSFHPLPCIGSPCPAPQTTWVQGFGLIREGQPAIFNNTGTSFTGPACAGPSSAVGSSTHCSANIYMSDGGNHPLWATGPTSFIAVDGSGYRMDMPSTFATCPLNANCPGRVDWMITDAEGNRSTEDSTAGITDEDTNGNQITFDGVSTWTDTIGRTISTAAWGNAAEALVQGQTTNTTGCVGPLPILYAVTWNPPGINGGTYSLKFCYVQVPVTMPVAPTFGSQSFNAVDLQSVILPDNSAWIFQYTTDG